jgi:hypothetical protein
VASINEHYCKASEKFSCSEGPDCASDSPDPSTRNGREVEIHPIVVGVQEPPMDRDNRHTYIHTNTLCSSPANAFCAAFFSSTDLEKRRRS